VCERERERNNRGPVPAKAADDSHSHLKSNICLEFIKAFIYLIFMYFMQRPCTSFSLVSSPGRCQNRKLIKDKHKDIVLLI